MTNDWTPNRITRTAVATAALAVLASSWLRTDYGSGALPEDLVSVAPALLLFASFVLVTMGLVAFALAAFVDRPNPPWAVYASVGGGAVLLLFSLLSYGTLTLLALTGLLVGWLLWVLAPVAGPSGARRVR